MAALLSAARRWLARPPARTVLVALFDAEEPPFFLTDLMGSTWFYTRQRREEVHAAIVLDLVGHDVPVPGLGELLFLTGIESHPGLEAAVTAAGEWPGLRLVPTLNWYVLGPSLGEEGDLSDYHVFRVNRHPYLFLTCGRWAHYHAPTDTPERLNSVKLAAVSDYLVRLVEIVAATELPPNARPHDTTATELRFIRAALGPLLRQLGVELRTRRDIDRLAELMLAAYGL